MPKPPQMDSKALPTLLTPTSNRHASDGKVSFFNNDAGKVVPVTPPATPAPVEMPQRIKELVLKLDDPDVAPRYHAAEALAILGPESKTARRALEAALLKDTNVHVRKSIARALGDIGASLRDARSVPLLKHILALDEDKFVRQRAQEALDAIDGVCRL